MSGLSVKRGRPRFALANPGPVTAASDGADPRRLTAWQALTLFTTLSLAACAAHQSATAVAPEAPGFWLGVWHGFIFPVAAILSIFLPDVSIYAVPNNGGWYDFGYFIGIMFLGVGSHRTRKVYVERRLVRG